MTLKVKVMQRLHSHVKVNDLEFQDHAIEIENFNYYHWFS